MAFLLTDFQTQLDHLISASDTEVWAITRQRAIIAAVEKYGRDRPDTYVETMAGDGGKYYDITAGLTYWVNNICVVLEVEYPAAIIANEEILQPIPNDEWQIFQEGDVFYLYFPHRAPVATENMRIKYSVPFEWTASTITLDVAQTAHGLSEDDYCYQDESDIWQETPTIRNATYQVSAVADADNFTGKVLQCSTPTEHFHAICYLAACLTLRAMSAKMASISDSTIAADASARGTPSGTAAARANDFCKMYAEALGLGGAETRPIAHSAFVDWDDAPGFSGGRDYMFHGRRLR